MIKVSFSRNFKKKLKNLSKKTRLQFYERLGIFVIDKYNPILKNHQLNGDYEGSRSINIAGDLRAIFDDYGDIVIFINIGDHHQLYGK
ncbi:MAG: type II toxin-antitoxin system mRNA interferase toxin, RelE/StbE family [Candidatus Vogelbacteria bacterium]|nr:type II toxin-antitoxin system mRNA interferase toxin, RelE/StbE family [Candidatus Vogelbacteria bacterium]